MGILTEIENAIHDKNTAEMFQATEAPDVGDKVEYDPQSRSESGIDLNSGYDDSDSDEDQDDGRIYF